MLFSPPQKSYRIRLILIGNLLVHNFGFDTECIFQQYFLYQHNYHLNVNKYSSQFQNKYFTRPIIILNIMKLRKKLS